MIYKGSACSLSQAPVLSLVCVESMLFGGIPLRVWLGKASPQYLAGRGGGGSGPKYV